MDVEANDVALLALKVNRVAGQQVVAQLLAQGLELVAALAQLAEGAGCWVLLVHVRHAFHARPARQRRVRSKSGRIGRPTPDPARAGPSALLVAVAASEA